MPKSKKWRSGFIDTALIITSLLLLGLASALNLVKKSQETREKAVNECSNPTGNLNEIRCVGNDRKQCKWSNYGGYWYPLGTCTYGCANGACKPQPHYHCEGAAGNCVQDDGWGQYTTANCDNMCQLPSPPPPTNTPRPTATQTPRPTTTPVPSCSGTCYWGTSTCSLIGRYSAQGTCPGTAICCNGLLPTLTPVPPTITPYPTNTPAPSCSGTCYWGTSTCSLLGRSPASGSCPGTAICCGGFLPTSTPIPPTSTPTPRCSVGNCCRCNYRYASDCSCSDYASYCTAGCPTMTPIPPTNTPTPRPTSTPRPTLPPGTTCTSSGTYKSGNTCYQCYYPGAQPQVIDCQPTPTPTRPLPTTMPTPKPTITPLPTIPPGTTGPQDPNCICLKITAPNLVGGWFWQGAGCSPEMRSQSCQAPKDKIPYGFFDDWAKINCQPGELVVYQGISVADARPLCVKREELAAVQKAREEAANISAIALTAAGGYMAGPALVPGLYSAGTTLMKASIYPLAFGFAGQLGVDTYRSITGQGRENTSAIINAIDDLSQISGQVGVTTASLGLGLVGTGQVIEQVSSVPQILDQVRQNLVNRFIGSTEYTGMYNPGDAVLVNQMLAEEGIIPANYASLSLSHPITSFNEKNEQYFEWQYAEEKLKWLKLRREAVEAVERIGVGVNLENREFGMHLRNAEANYYPATEKYNAQIYIADRSWGEQPPNTGYAFGTYRMQVALLSHEYGHHEFAGFPGGDKTLQDLYESEVYARMIQQQQVYQQYLATIGKNQIAEADRILTSVLSSAGVANEDALRTAYTSALVKAFGYNPEDLVKTLLRANPINIIMGKGEILLLPPGN